MSDFASKEKKSSTSTNQAMKSSNSGSGRGMVSRPLQSRPLRVEPLRSVPLQCRPLGSPEPEMEAQWNRNAPQAQLKVGSSSDPLEKEADATAEKVMRMGNAGSGTVSGVGEEPEISRKESSGGEVQVSPETSAKIESSRGGGQALPASERAFFEPRFGKDFSDVNVHTDSKAAEASQDLNARVFTIGNDVFFNAGEYKPGTGDGRFLMAHELAHTLQQDGKGIVRREKKTKKISDNKFNPAPKKTIERKDSLLIQFQNIGIFLPSESDAWNFLAEKVLRLERKGLRYSYRELFGNNYRIEILPFENDANSFDWRFSNKELGTIATVRFEADRLNERGGIYKFFVLLPFTYKDGTALVYEGKSFSGGVKNVELVKVDYENQVDIIIKSLNGFVTFYSDSLRVMKIFREAGAGGLRTLLHRFKSRSKQHGRTPQEMIQWLFDELKVNHREELKQHLIINNAVNDLAPILAKELWKKKEEDKIHQWSLRFFGPALDYLLLSLQKESGKTFKATSIWLFGTMEVLQREDVRKHFLESNSIVATEFALLWTVHRVNNLLDGHTGILDSGSIVWNFRQIPTPKLRKRILQSLHTADKPNIDQRLMGKIEHADYQKLQALGLKLRPNNYVKDWKDMVLEHAEWKVITAQVLAGGLVGIVKGGVELVWDIAEDFVELVGSVYHLFMLFFFMLSKGAIGDESVGKIEKLIQGVDGFAGDPRAVIEKAYLNTLTESNAFEGPFEAFHRAAFWSKHIVKFIIAIVVIIKGVKALRKGVRNRPKKDPGSNEPERMPIHDSVPARELDKILAYQVKVGEHEIKVTQLGRIFICSDPCTEAREILDKLRVQYLDLPVLKDRLEKLYQEIGKLEADIRDGKVHHDKIEHKLEKLLNKTIRLREGGIKAFVTEALRVKAAEAAFKEKFSESEFVGHSMEMVTPYSGDVDLVMKRKDGSLDFIEVGGYTKAFVNRKIDFDKIQAQLGKLKDYADSRPGIARAHFYYVKTQSGETIPEGLMDAAANILGAKNVHYTVE